MSTGTWNKKPDFVIRDLYVHYRESTREKGNVEVNQSIFSKVLKDFNAAIIDEIVYNAYEFRLPHRLGSLRVKKIKQKIKLTEDGKLDTSNLAPNWKATMDLWGRNPKAKEEKKLIFHTNKHTSGYYFRWFWNKSTCNVKNSSVYKLEMTKVNKKKITKAVTSNENIDYYE